MTRNTKRQGRRQTAVRLRDPDADKFLAGLAAVRRLGKVCDELATTGRIMTTEEIARMADVGVKFARWHLKEWTDGLRRMGMRWVD